MTQYAISDLSQENLNKELYKAAQNGDLDYIKYLLTSTELKLHADPNLNGNYCFKLACRSGHLDTVKYLFSDENTKLKLSTDRLIIDGTLEAADNNQIEILDYFRNQAKINNHYTEARFINDNLVILERACAFGFLETVDYILQNPKVENYVLDEKTIFNLFESCIYANSSDLIKYFIFELNLKNTESVTKLLDEVSEEQKKEIEQLFELRQLNQSLNSELEHNQNNTKKHKV
jgi:hypothetical protein